MTEARIAAWRIPEIRQRIIACQRAYWTPERRAAVGEWAKRLWENRKLAIQEAEKRPIDWCDKPLFWRIIGDILLSRNGHMTNVELGNSLDKAQLIQCPYSESWSVAPSSDVETNNNAAAVFVAKVRRWVRKSRKQK